MVVENPTWGAPRIHGDLPPCVGPGCTLFSNFGPPVARWQIGPGTGRSLLKNPSGPHFGESMATTNLCFSWLFAKNEFLGQSGKAAKGPFSTTF
jgi:hypothetical protein